MMNKIEYSPIGIIHSPFKTPEGTPIQSSGAAGAEGIIEIFREYIEGLEDLGGFSHILLLYHFHLSKRFNLRVKPFLDDTFHGLFATRAPSRPNPIGISVVRLTRVDSEKLYVKDIDVVDGTPLLDIKPYVPEFDARKVDRIGWLENVSIEVGKTYDDGRFTK